MSAALPPTQTTIAARTFRLLVITGIALWITAALMGSINNSATSDELCHIGDGLAVIHYGDFRMNPEHPPILKVLSALPVYLIYPPPFDSYEQLRQLSPWRLGFQGPFAYHTLFFSDDVPAQYRLFVARMVPLGIGLLGGWLAWRWGRRIGGGKTSAACAAFLLLFYPEYIGNAGFVTFDVPLMVTCAFVATAAWHWWRRPGWKSGAVYTLACMIAPFVKTPGAVFVIAASLLVAAFPFLPPRRATIRQTALLALAVTAGIFLMAWTVYGFRYAPLESGAIDYNPNPYFPPIVSDKQTTITKTVNMIHRWHILPEAALSPLAHLDRFSTRWYFLNGETSTSGWYHYFLVTFLLKTTPALIAACLIPIVHWFAGGRRTPSLRGMKAWKLAILWIPFAVLAFLTITSRINYGHRYILFLYFPLCATIGALCGKWLEAGGWRRIAAALLLLSHITSFALAFPHFSTYFNFITGTPYKALPYVRENNTDWGQDVARLGAWVRNNGVQRMNLALYGLNAPAQYAMQSHNWIDPELIYPIPLIKAAPPEPGIPTAISVNELPRMRKFYPGLFDRDPDLYINSIVIYLPQP